MLINREIQGDCGYFNAAHRRLTPINENTEKYRLQHFYRPIHFISDMQNAYNSKNLQMNSDRFC